MGQCYSVCARLHFKNGDSKEWCQKIAEYIKDQTEKETAIFRKHTKNDLLDPWKCFTLITSNQQVQENKKLDVWLSDFSASYGWGHICINAFEYAMDALEHDSFVVVEPWESDPMSLYFGEDGTLWFSNYTTEHFIGYFKQPERVFYI